MLAALLNSFSHLIFVEYLSSVAEIFPAYLTGGHVEHSLFTGRVGDLQGMFLYIIEQCAHLAAKHVVFFTPACGCVVPAEQYILAAVPHMTFDKMSNERTNLFSH